MTQQKGYYNGFSMPYRLLVFEVQKDLREAEQYVQWQETNCDLCGNHSAGDFSDGNYAHGNLAHLENYNNVHDYKVLCVACHMRLHTRFHLPSLWLWHLDQLSQGKKIKLFHTVKEWFKGEKQKKFASHVSAKPTDFGNNWENNLLMEAIDICQGEHYYEKGKSYLNDNVT